MVVKVSPEESVKVTRALANPLPFGDNTRPLTDTVAAVGIIKIGGGLLAKVPAPAAVKLFRKIVPSEKIG